MLLEVHQICREDLFNPKPVHKLAKLIWDDDLACVAQGWAEQCTTGHDQRDNREIPGKYPQRVGSTGQNAAFAWYKKGKTYNTEDLVWGWCDEQDQWQYNVGPKFDESEFPVGHFTQMVWENTTHIGCGMATCDDGGGWEMLTIVCNYGPPGNIGRPGEAKKKPYQA